MTSLLSRSYCCKVKIYGFVLLLFMPLTLVSGNTTPTVNTELEIALSLADMLRAARTVVARNQSIINDPAVGDKSLSGDAVVQQMLATLSESATLKADALIVDDRQGRYLRYLSQAIKEIIDENQTLINRQGMGFKGFVPAVFARLVNERFSELAGKEAQLKVTAPLDLIRNRKARPDKWEMGVLENQFRNDAWIKGDIVAETAESGGRLAFRVMVPEYYGAACMSCHGSPKAAVDITGYPKEGALVDALAGGISITLFK